MEVDAVGMLFAGYVSGPARKGLLLPIGSCTCFDAKQQIVLTASHVLSNIPQEIDRGISVDIKPHYRELVVGLPIIGLPACQKWKLFRVERDVEILPEITALYLSKTATDGSQFPDQLVCSISSEPIRPLFPVYMAGYPGSIQRVEYTPDEDLMEIEGYSCSNFLYEISGIVASYFKDECPPFIEKRLLPVFTVDNGVLPGMSGGAVISAVPRSHSVVGIIVKNIEIRGRCQGENYSINHALAVSIHDIAL